MNKLLEKIKEYWKDAVWSKVIATGIIFILGTIFTSLYAIFKIIYSKISFKDTFTSIEKTLTKEISIQIWVFILILIVFLIFSLNSIFILIQSIFYKFKKTKEEKEIEIPTANEHSTVLFSYRMAKAFPGIRNLTWFNEPAEAVKRLEILLNEPLKFKNGFEYCESDPIWWFRGHSASHIEIFKKLGRKKILINFDQLKIKRIAAYHGNSYYRDFVYIETYGEKQIGLYNISDEEIKENIKYFGYSWEEYGLIKNFYFWKKPIKREHYDDGATIIRGKVVNTDDAELRVRYLSNYNLIISSKGSPYNCTLFDNESKKYFDGILKGEIEFDEFFEFLKKLHKR